MKKTLIPSIFTIIFSIFAYAAHAKTVVEFAYPYAGLFDVTYEKILPKFYEQNPDIEIKIRAPYENYEDGTNSILRESVANTLPDVTMQGLNRQAILVEKGIAKSLEPYIAKEADFSKDGYHAAMLKLSTFGDDVYGLPFSISLPVGYYNMDIMAKAGIATISDLPKTWDEVISACQKLISSGIKQPMFWGWNITGNWFLQALMWSQGQALMENGAFMIDTPAGLKALETMQALFEGCNMPNLGTGDAQAFFNSGNSGMFFWSTSSVAAVERGKTDFDFRTNEYPGLVASGPMGLPAGGNAAMLVSQSEDPKVLDASWRWLKFITSGEGAADVARTTGYMPPNQAANDIILKDFYAQNPNNATAVRQLPLFSDWQAYPGDNGLAITQVIYDSIEGIVTDEFNDMKELQEIMKEEVTDLLPR